jgi:arylsulfatase A-like enzyme
MIKYQEVTIMNNIKITRRNFINISFKSSALLLAPSLYYKQDALGQENKSPNIIFILSDDQGWNGTSVQMKAKSPDSKSDYHFTPNLERLAKGGMCFSQGYSPAALCCPTRRSIQFGQTPARQGDDAQFEKNYSPNNQKLTIPRMLKAVNPKYRAAHFGKWDLRTDLTPEDLGYDESDGNTRNSTGSLGSNFDNKEKWKKFTEMEDPKRIFSITNRAVGFMERQVKAKNPFYLQISHYAVHVAMQTRNETLQKYENKDKGRLHKIPAFAGMTEDLDSGLGKVLDKIEELKIANNTYIFYLADNGAVPWIPPDKKKHLGNPLMFKGDPSRNFPLRAGKWMLYEGGIRVPFLVSGPGIKPGSNSDVPVIGWDLLPTIADLAGYKKPMPSAIDGGSFRSLLENQGNGVVKRPWEGFVFHRYSDGYPHSSIRIGDYKLVRFWKNGELYLFDLKNDIGETNNLAKKSPQKTQSLEKKLMVYLRSVNSNILERYGDL